MTIRIEATYENAKHLPIGTQVVLVDSTESRGRWDGRAHVKTGGSSWSLIGENFTPEQVAGLVTRREIGVSPCPDGHGGYWLIADAEALFAGMVENADKAERTLAHERTLGSAARSRLADIESFVSGEGNWVESDEE